MGGCGAVFAGAALTLVLCAAAGAGIAAPARAHAGAAAGKSIISSQLERLPAGSAGRPALVSERDVGRRARWVRVVAS